jgi:TolB-like protein
MNRIAHFATVVAAAASLAAPVASLHAQTSAKPTVAIMYFNNNAFGPGAKDYDGLVKGVPDFLITEMSSNPNIRVIERDQVQKLVDEQKLSTDGRVDPATAARIGKLLGAQHMIFGGFAADPKGNFRIDARAVNVETGLIEHVERVQDRADNVMPLIDQLAARMNKGMNLPANPVRTGDASAPTGAALLASSSTSERKTLPMKYAVMYGKALDMADRGDKTRAVELFGAVLKEFPDYGPAKSGISKLKPGA